MSLFHLSTGVNSQAVLSLTFYSRFYLSLFPLMEKVTKPACRQAGSSRTTRSAPRVCPANASTLPKVHLYYLVVGLADNESICSFNAANAKSLHLFS